MFIFVVIAIFTIFALDKSLAGISTLKAGIGHVVKRLFTTSSSDITSATQEKNS
jgi:hypothetical protein